MGEGITWRDATGRTHAQVVMHDAMGPFGAARYDESSA